MPSSTPSQGPALKAKATDIDQIMSKYRSICSDLDSDLKRAAQQIKNEKQAEYKQRELT